MLKSQQDQIGLKTKILVSISVFI